MLLWNRIDPISQHSISMFMHINQLQWTLHKAFQYITQSSFNTSMQHEQHWWDYITLTYLHTSDIVFTHDEIQTQMLYKIYSKFCHKAKPHFTIQSHFLIQYHNSARVHTRQIQYQLFGVRDPLSVCTYAYMHVYTMNHNQMCCLV